MAVAVVVPDELPPGTALTEVTNGTDEVALAVGSGGSPVLRLPAELAAG